MKKLLFISLLSFCSILGYSQSEATTQNPSVFVLSFPEDATDGKKTIKNNNLSIDKTAYMTEQNGLVILGYETIYPEEYIQTLDKAALTALLKSINSEGFAKLNELMGATPENPVEKNTKFKNAAETIITTAKVNGLNFESTTLRSQNNFLQIIFIGEVKSKEAQDFMAQLEIIVVE